MSHFLKTADIFAVHQSDDRVPMSTYLCKMSQSGGDRVPMSTYLWKMSQSGGDRVPMSTDLWKMSQSGGDRVSAQFFRTALGFWLGFV